MNYSEICRGKETYENELDLQKCSRTKARMKLYECL